VFKSIDERYPEGWLTVNPSGIDKNGYGGESNEEYDARIDHVFLAPEIAVTRAEVRPSVSAWLAPFTSPFFPPDLT
jgi:hypothetical protein